MKHRCHYRMPIGNVCIEEECGNITAIYIDKEASGDDSSTPLLQRAGSQLSEYFQGKRKEFDLPLAPVGTDFQRRVWDALLTIPYGKTRSYGEIAAQIGQPKASRAVGGANNRNPIMIVIPCHRVIGANGSLTGYGGGLDVKQYLLELEKGR